MNRDLSNSGGDSISELSSILQIEDQRRKKAAKEVASPALWWFATPMQSPRPGNRVTCRARTLSILKSDSTVIGGRLGIRS